MREACVWCAEYIYMWPSICVLWSNRNSSSSAAPICPRAIRCARDVFALNFALTRVLFIHYLFNLKCVLYVSRTCRICFCEKQQRCQLLVNEQLFIKNERNNADIIYYVWRKLYKYTIGIKHICYYMSASSFDKFTMFEIIDYKFRGEPAWD